MTKKEMSEAVLAAKKAKGLTWAKLAEQVGVGEVWLASCGHGENCLDPESAEKLAGVLGLGADVRAALVRALDGVLDTRGADIRRLAEQGDRRQALAARDELWSRLVSARAAGLSRDDLEPAVTKARRLFAPLDG